MNKNQKPELLAPAGNLDILKIAFMYGADAVYCGTPLFAMRSRVGFDLDSLKEGINYAHSISKKVYVTLNAFPHANEIEEAKKHALEIIKLHPDALIIADPGMIAFVKENTGIPIHLSTQASTTNYLTANFWLNQGIDRIVLARELSLDDIKLIHQHSKIEIETFIHGAMCMAYSGRCQISNYLVGRDPNRGQCIQACRFKYKMYGLEEEFRPGEIFPIYEDETGTHILNSKDLCMIEYLSKLINAGVVSLKIEGRLKTEYYVATTIRAYRQAIDLYFKSHEEYKKARNKFKKEVIKASNRGFTTGFYFEKPTKETNNYASSKAKSDWGYIGRVLNYDSNKKILTFEAKNHLPLNSSVEIMTPAEVLKKKITKMFIKNEPAEVAHANNIVSIPFNTEVPKDSLLRIKLN